METWSSPRYGNDVNFSFSSLTVVSLRTQFSISVRFVLVISSIDWNHYGDRIGTMGRVVGRYTFYEGGGRFRYRGDFLYTVPGPPFTSGSRKFDSNQTIMMDFNRNFVHNGRRCAWKSERPDTGTRRHRPVHCFRVFVDATSRRRVSINCVR